MSSRRGSLPGAARAWLAVVIVAISAASCAHAPPPPDASLVVKAPPGAQLFIDDVYAGLCRAEPLPLRSGFHRVEVRAEGRLSALREVTVAPGQRATLEVTLRPDVDALGSP